MKNYIILILLLGWGALPTIWAQTPTPASVVVDTTKLPSDTLARSPNWTVRSPLSPEEAQRRAERQAELDDMKRRFRRFNKENPAQPRGGQEEDDFLWDEAQTGGAVMPTPVTSPQDSLVVVREREEMQREISRNLHQARKPDVWQGDSAIGIRSPQADVPGWQTDIQQAFRPALINPQGGSPLQAGQLITLRDIQFADGEANLTAAMHAQLAYWAKLLAAYPGMVVEIRVHTHHDQPAFAAQELTRERATQLANYLVAQGAQVRQVGYRGYGQLSPLVPVTTPQAKVQNERIELIILELPPR